jgi:hypothetical protein
MGARAGLWAVGRVGASQGDPQRAYSAARTVEAALRRATAGAWRETDRNGLLRRAWELLGAEPPASVGGGLDATVLLVAEDELGVGVAGVGLGAVWGVVDGALRRLVPRGHPLLGPPGLPGAVPGVLTLDGPLPTDVIGAPHELAALSPVLDRLERQCGVLP